MTKTAWDHLRLQELNGDDQQAMDTFMSSSHRSNVFFPKLLLTSYAVTQGAAPEVSMTLTTKMPIPERAAPESDNSISPTSEVLCRRRNGQMVLRCAARDVFLLDAAPTP